MLPCRKVVKLGLSGQSVGLPRMIGSQPESSYRQLGRRARPGWTSSSAPVKSKSKNHSVKKSNESTSICYLCTLRHSQRYHKQVNVVQLYPKITQEIARKRFMATSCTLRHAEQFIKSCTESGQGKVEKSCVKCEC